MFSKNRTCVVVMLFLVGVARAQPPPEPVPAEPPPPPPADVPAPEPAAAVAEPAPAEPEEPALKMKYDKGIKLATTDESFAFNMNIRTQARYESTRSLEDGSEFESRFMIPRARLSISGHGFGKGAGSVGYKVELSLSDRGAFTALKDVFSDVRPGAAKVWLRVGQWKRPFIRQWITPAFSTQFNERAVTSGFAGNGRDLGAAIHNKYDKSPEGLEWVFGVFNGFSGAGESPKTVTVCEQDPVTLEIECRTATPTNLPGDFGPAFVARTAWNVGNVKGYSEGDTEGGPLRLSVGAAYKFDLANFAKPVGDNVSHGVELDSVIKVQGFSLTVAGYLMKLKTADAGIGGHVQAGYFVVPKRVEVAGRFATVPAADDRRVLEVRGALQYMLHGHRLKLATDFGMVQLTGEDPVTMETSKPELQLRTMLQAIL